ncbi:hypothetical protein MASR2M78_16490 [Treponema sp.]
MKLRPISIYDIQLLSYEEGKARVHVHCSKGTYIRSLARDIGRAVASCAYLGELTRLAVGSFNLSDAFAGFADEKENTDLWKSQLRPIDERTFAALKVPSLRVGEEIQKFLSNGRILNGDWFQPLSQADPLFPLALCDKKGRFLAIIENDGQKWLYRYVASGSK